MLLCACVCVCVCVCACVFVALKRAVVRKEEIKRGGAVLGKVFQFSSNYSRN